MPRVVPLWFVMVVVIFRKRSRLPRDSVWTTLTPSTQPSLSRVAGPPMTGSVAVLPEPEPGVMVVIRWLGSSRRPVMVRVAGLVVLSGTKESNTSSSEGSWFTTGVMRSRESEGMLTRW